LLQSADLRFCNLECPVARGGTAITKRYSFRADPALAAQALRAGKIDIVSLANNHTYDYGRDGLRETIDNMSALHIAAPGAGRGRAGAIAPRLITCHGLKIAIVAYTWWVPEGYLPADNTVCPAIGDEETLAKELKAAKVGADLLIVSMHWGRKYSPTATNAQRRLAHLVIKAGADLILGSHPHVAEPIEIYHGRPIIYSLGNCLFDRSGRHTANGLLVLVRLAKDKVSVEKKVPLLIGDGRPTPAK
jgi:poly-gamma-glutamate synthesis protein (capsule biosynthesis protein)